jgi:hypothetical protein
LPQQIVAQFSRFIRVQTAGQTNHNAQLIGLFWNHVRAGFEVRGYFLGSQGGFVNAKFINGTVNRLLKNSKWTIFAHANR